MKGKQFARKENRVSRSRRMINRDIRFSKNSSPHLLLNSITTLLSPLPFRVGAVETWRTVNKTFDRNASNRKSAIDDQNFINFQKIATILRLTKNFRIILINIGERGSKRVIN